ncbi:UNVERIFIED_CONTAM: hypothetical protein DES50_10645 [Williamsia faeni]
MRPVTPACQVPVRPKSSYIPTPTPAPTPAERAEITVERAKAVAALSFSARSAVTKARSAVGLARSTEAEARIPRGSARQGVRDLTYDERTGEFLILLGRTISRDDEPFQLCTWNGRDDHVQLLDVVFHRSMKPECITTFSSGGENKILIVDDDGGYAVLG